MKKRDLETLRKKDVKELEKTLEGKRRDFLVSYNEVKAGQEKDLSKPGNIRKDIAQILTILKEKKIIEREVVEKNDNNKEVEK